MISSTQEVNVTVAVRVRPLLAREKVTSNQSCIKIYSDTGQIVIGKNHAFTFDFGFGPDSSQVDVYSKCVNKLIDNCFDGYNATIFAYGQTSSGKTYTIGDGLETDCDEEEFLDTEGMLPRAIKQIFENIDCADKAITVKISYVEIYQDELRDLLSPQTSSKDLHIRETSADSTVVYGIKQELCHTAHDVVAALQEGSAIRQTASTNMNERSSRSHTIFTILIEQNWSDKSVIGSSDDTQSYMCSTLNFVDLAGSERAHKTANVGARFKESIHINTGLLALGNVISALGDPKRKATHIPYRDSKITRLLKDSLGGNARTLMVCCVSPAASNFDESLNALKYANRARNIRNKPVVNRDPHSVQIELMKTEISALRQQLEDRGSAIRGYAGDREMSSLEEKISDLQKECSSYRSLADNAYEQLLEIQRRKFLTASLSSNLSNWIGLVNEARGAGGDFKGNLGDTILGQELERCRNALEKDEQAFAEKEKELEVLRKRVVELEADNENLCDRLNSKVEEVKLDEDKLLETEMRVMDLEQQQHRSESARSLVTPSSAAITDRVFRPTSVPAHVIHEESELQLPITGRQIHSSPAIFSLERVMQSFRARSQLLIYKIEDDDEVLRSPSSGTASALSSRQKVMRKDTYKVSDKPTVESRRAVSESSDSDETVVGRSREFEQDKISELETNIRLKEQLIRDLVKSTKQADTNRDELMSRIETVEREKQVISDELGEVKKALLAEQRPSSRKAAKEQQVTLLQKRLKEQVDRKIQLEKELAKEQSKSAGLQQKADKQQKLLKVKTEELSAVRRRLSSAGGTRQVDPAELQKLEDGKRYLDEQVEAILGEKEQMQLLEQELRQREDLLLKKEALLEERSRLELKRARASQVLNQSVTDMNAEMASINKSLSEKQREIENEQISREKLQHLKKERDQLKQRRDSLDKKIQKGVLLSEQEERRISEFDEAIETLDEALSYKNDAIHSRQVQVRQSHVLMAQSQDEVFGRLSGCSAGELRLLLATLLDKVVNLKEENRVKNLQRSEMEVELDEKKRMLASMQVAIQKIGVESKVKSPDNSGQVVELESQNRQLKKNVSILEKELYYYKKTSKDLRKKVKELSTSTSSTTNHTADESVPPQETTTSLTIIGKAQPLPKPPEGQNERRVKSASRIRNQVVANLHAKKTGSRIKSAPVARTETPKKGTVTKAKHIPAVDTRTVTLSPAGGDKNSSPVTVLEVVPMNLNSSPEGSKTFDGSAYKVMATSTPNDKEGTLTEDMSFRDSLE